MARKMRDSGVEWIGEVPEGWEITPLKKCFEKTFSGIWGTDAGVGEETVTCYRIADFNYAEGIVSTNKLTKRSYKCEELEDKLVRKGDLLLEKSGGGDLNPVGRAVLVNHDDKATCSNFIQALRCNAECDERFVCYMLQTSYSRGVNGLYYNQTIGIQNLQVGKYLSIRLPMPHLPEQRRIADYLDEKCGAIDAAITEAKKGIEEYKAWKKSLIFKAVTGKRRVGVFNAETQSRREAEKMKSSGIPWIGEIPEGWRVCRVKEVATIKTGNTPDKQYQNEYYSTDSGVPWIKAENLGFMVPISQTAEYLTEEGVKQGRIFPPRTVFVCCIASIGKVGYSEKVASCNQQLNALVFNSRMYWKYGFYVTIAAEEEYLVRASGNVVKILNSSEQGLIAVPLPSIPEQQAIADYLDEKCAAIDAMVAEKEALIADLESYKKSLIYEVVTGKREVA